jgi:hypothetical protein
MGQEDDGMQIRNARTRLPVLNCNNITARTGFQGRNTKTRFPGHDYGD